MLNRNPGSIDARAQWRTKHNSTSADRPSTTVGDRRGNTSLNSACQNFWKPTNLNEAWIFSSTEQLFARERCVPHQKWRRHEKKDNTSLSLHFTTMNKHSPSYINLCSQLVIPSDCVLHCLSYIPDPPDVKKRIYGRIDQEKAITRCPR